MTGPRMVAIAALLGSFILDLLLSSVAVARAAFSPVPRLRPAIVPVPVDLVTPGGVAAFACLLSLSPGSVALHVTPDRRTIFVHLLDTKDEAASVARFKRLFERRIARVERP